MKTSLRRLCLCIALAWPVLAAAQRNPEPALPASAESAPIPAAPLVADDDVQRSTAAHLPNVALTSELLYKLLVAEFSLENGQWQGAYASFLETAQQTRDPRLARRAAEAALAGNNLGDAYTAVRLWHTLSPESKEADQSFLGLSILTGNLDTAEPQIADMLRAAKAAELGATLFQVARLLTQSKDLKAAFALTEKLFAPYKQRVETHLALAQSAFALGDKARSADEARQALAIDPGSQIAALLAAQSAVDPAAALAQLAQFLKGQPNADEVRLAYGRLLAEQKQYDAARKEFLTLQKKKPDEPTLLYALGVLSLQVGRADEARSWFERYLQNVQPDLHNGRDGRVPIYLILAQIALDSNDAATALSWLDKVPAGEPRAKTWFETQLQRALLMARLGKVEDARKLVAGIEPANKAEEAQRIMVEAQILRNAQRNQEAYDVLDSGARRFPDDASLLYDFALTAEKLKRYDVLEKTLRRVMVLDPGNAQVYNALGYSFVERGIRLDEAAPLLETALTLAPNDPYVLDSLGWLRFRQGKLAEAESLVRRAYTTMPDAEVAAHLGEILWSHGKHREAAALLHAALQRAPDNTALKAVLQRVGSIAPVKSQSESRSALP